MKNTDEESADLKQRLRTLPNTPALEQEAGEFPIEADEAVEETERGLILAVAGSYVAAVLARTHAHTADEENQPTPAAPATPGE